MINKIRVIPNSGIYKKKESFFVINTMKFFFLDLVENSNKKIQIIAVSLNFQNNHYLDEICHEKIKIDVPFNYSSNKFFNIFNYNKLFFSYIFSFFFKKHTFHYAFFPGNIPLINIYFALIFNKKFGLYVRGSLNQEGSLKTILYNYAIKRSKFCLVTGQKLLEEVSEINDKTEVVSAMINYSKNDLSNESNFIQKKDKFRFLYVGRISRDKGIYDLLQAFNILKNNHKKIELIIIGNIALNEKDDISNYFKSNSSLDIDFRGAIKDSEELKNEYLKSDCFVLPSHHEGFPRVLYESMIFKTPIITSDLPGICHEMIHNVNCIKYPVANIKSLTDSMSQVINNMSLRSRICEGGARFMDDYFKKSKGSHGLQVLQMINKYVD